MKNIICFILITCCLFSCRRKDTYPDYANIIGKYKLIYIKKGNSSWPYDSIVRIYPSDKYEIEFKKMSKVMLSKNDNCEDKLKVYSCKSSSCCPQNASYTFLMNIDRTDYEFAFPFYPSVNNVTDTLVAKFYPFDFANDVGDTYVCVYFKE